MKKKYFVVSDIHGHYYQLVRDLKEAGYDKENSEHVLICLGDIFDRGRQPLEIYDFLRSISKERRILVRGNHETLLKDLVDRGYAETHDEHNGTYLTLWDIAQVDYDEWTHDYYEELLKYKFESSECTSYRERKKAEKKEFLFHNSKIREILDWIASDEWVNYYETKDYIFVHSWIPLCEHIDWTKTRQINYLVKSGPDTYREDWRNATQQEWEDAMWGCPWKKAKEGLNETGKTIVCGHWHTSDFFNNLKNKNSKKIYDIHNNPIYESKRYKLIGIDACTAVTLVINVFKFEE